MRTILLLAEWFSLQSIDLRASAEMGEDVFLHIGMIVVLITTHDKYCCDDAFVFAFLHVKQLPLL